VKITEHPAQRGKGQITEIGNISGSCDGKGRQCRKRCGTFCSALYRNCRDSVTIIILKNARRMAFFDVLPRRSKGLSFANSEISRQPQAIDLARRIEELALVVIIVRKLHDVALALAHQSRWEHQEVCTDAVQRCRQILRRQA